MKAARLAFVALVVAAAALAVAIAALASRTSAERHRHIKSAIRIDTLVVRRHDGLYTIRTDGSRPRLLVRGAVDPAWSPDGRYIAYIDPKLRGIWVIRGDGSGRRRLTSTLPETERQPCCGLDDRPSWSPDGRRIVFHREWITSDGQPVDLYAVDVNTRRLERLTHSPDRGEFNPSWSPDGHQIAFDDDDFNIVILNLSTHRLKRLTDAQRYGFTPFSSPGWSPNGKRLVFTMDLGDRKGMRSQSCGSTARGGGQL